MDCSTPGFPVRHQLPELAQTHIYWVGDAIQPSHPLSSPSSSALNLSQHQSLFQWVGSLHQVAEILELQLQHQSFQWTFRVDLLQNGLVGSPCSPRDSQESSPESQLEIISSLALSLLYGPTFISIQDYWKNHSFDYTGLFGKVMSLLFNALSRFVKMKETWLNAWVIWVRSWNRKRILRKNWQNLNIVWSLVNKNIAMLVT